ncbi:MAG: hypothetical protein RL660_124 [Bacteroidota bacterium]
MLQAYYQDQFIEAGCDEAGRGCLAGPVFAAAVILPQDFSNSLLNDSKQLSENDRYALRKVIEQEAVAFAVAKVSHTEIDKINILRASIRAMHLALAKLHVPPEFIVVDGNRFTKYKQVPHKTVIKGDGIYANIAAASILAKTYRDDFMLNLHKKFPAYDWQNNKGYPTAKHRLAIAKHGACTWHRKSFRLDYPVASLFD